ncbi:SGNH/GDSL hydrolase family protein [Actinoplanes teichomyceticus]|uniref:Lysophospholipase L1-like esterase n=1 Tax=Actinoplanes teichomyceticus TaxID=1867 RepID=A0A561WJY8_ACTTI|nr:SGNH/GDSL hydrolase family protein [Actinoplanes teichomyceticus]TWG24175.1 lysophospholipase L1-like esterase [Actinoplanes teichomyceticus]GIF12978.1 lipase [Actinoplanes teichomyceticus]
MRYVAIGDSFTEGMGDTQPDGSERGWADLVAAGLAAGLGEPIRYANLAIRGRLLRPIVTEQLDAALALDPKPTLLSLNGGGNDMMRPGGDLTALVEMTERAIRRCLDSGVQVLLLSGPDPSGRLPLGGMMRRKGEILTAAVAPFAQRYGLTFVDVFHDREIRRPGYWSADRLHLNAAGHRRVAGLVLTALGHPTTAHVIDSGPAGRAGLLAEARYYREHVLPWVQRRLRGQSSGDHRTGKYPDWISVPAAQPA